MASYGAIRCAVCRRSTVHWFGFECPGCGAFCRDLWDDEALDPAAARRMTPAQVDALHREAGLPAPYGGAA